MILTNDNYFSPEAASEYMSNSQFKSFKNCEAAALAELRGEFKRDSTTALLVGSYVDAYYEGTLENFKELHPEIFKRDGTLKIDYAQADSIIARTQRDPMFTKYMGGDKQVIMTGVIADVPYKIKIDSYHPDRAIVDLKIMCSLDRVWDEATRRKKSFIRYWGYDTQGAIYQEIVRQNTGKQLPFFIAAATKSKHPNIDVISVPQEWLDTALDEVKALTPRFAALKAGNEQPRRCERCGYCCDTKIITAPTDARDYEEDMNYADNI